MKGLGPGGIKRTEMLQHFALVTALPDDSSGVGPYDFPWAEIDSGFVGSVFV